MDRARGNSDGGRDHGADLTASRPAPDPATREHRHPRFFSPAVLLLVTPLCVLGSVVGVQILVRLGVTTNTSLIGALAGMALGRVPIGSLRVFRSPHVQNLAQSAISASTFGAANSLMLPIGIPFLLGRADLIWPMLAGATLAMLLDATLLYRMFGSRVFPADGAWPPGVAAAEAIKAGDKGGARTLILGGGLLFGVAGSIAGVPMAGFGVAFIGNAAALFAFAVGLLLRGYPHILASHVPGFATLAPGGDLGRTHIPQAVMLGAGLFALLQVLYTLTRGRSTGSEASRAVDRTLAATLGSGAGLYLVIAVLIAVAAGFEHVMSAGLLVAFVVYAAFAALLHELIIGLAGMHSGWFPAFAVAVVTLGLGLLIGFPPAPLALLTGLTASTGPAFADMGCDLKAGYLLRGEGADADFERDGRRQQYLAAMFALVIAALVVAVTFHGFFRRGQVAPVDHVFVAAIKAGSNPAVAHALLVWAVPGAVLQLIGGARRQLGVLFATGLLLSSPLAGWAILAGLATRLAWTKSNGAESRSTMQVFAAGCIAGDALLSFGKAVI